MAEDIAMFDNSILSEEHVCKAHYDSGTLVLPVNTAIYTCGDCNLTFTTICQLHEHILNHDMGGSYHYDEHLKTAIPKYDSGCMETQTTWKDIREGRRIFRKYLWQKYYYIPKKRGPKYRKRPGEGDGDPEDPRASIKFRKKGANPYVPNATDIARLTKAVNDPTFEKLQKACLDTKVGKHLELSKAYRDEVLGTAEPREAYKITKKRTVDEPDSTDSEGEEIGGDVDRRALRSKDGGTRKSYVDGESSDEAEKIPYAGTNKGVEISGADTSGEKIAEDNESEEEMADDNESEEEITDDNESEEEEIADNNKSDKEEMADNIESEEEITDDNESEAISGRGNRRNLSSKETVTNTKCNDKGSDMNNEGDELSVENIKDESVVPDSGDRPTLESDMINTRINTRSRGFKLESGLPFGREPDKVPDHAKPPTRKRGRKKGVKTGPQPRKRELDLDPDWDPEKRPPKMTPVVKVTRCDEKVVNDVKTEGTYHCMKCNEDISMADKAAHRAEHARVSSREYQVKKRKEKVVCDVCGISFHEKDIEKHRRIKHTGETPYGCDVCEKRFHTAEQVRSHARLHTEAKLKCDYCQQRFHMQSQLKTHMQLHSGELDCICPQCGIRLRRYSLKLHIDTVHLNIRQFECDVCHKLFGRKTNLVSHKQSMHDNVVYQCSYCGRTFKDRSSRRRHEKTHTGETLHQCQFCEYKCIQSTPFYTHMSKEHGFSREQTKEMVQEKRLRESKFYLHNKDAIDVAPGVPTFRPEQDFRLEAAQDHSCEF